MRMMLKVQIDTEAGSKAIADGSMPRMLEQMMSQLKPEAAYFGPDDGVRTAFIVFDLESPSQIPAISEPLFKTAKAKLTWFPVMDRQDLQTGLRQISPQ